MKAAIYDPYLDTLGGGERYVITVAYVLRKHGWDVDLEWNDGGIKKRLENRLGVDLSGIKMVSDIHKGKGYDLVFWLSDGSIPHLSGKKNILHFQVPFHGVNGKSIFNRIKLRKIHTVVCNSQFTKRFINKEYGVDSVVVYPPVDIGKFDDLNHRTKTNIVLSVGRFSQLLQAKRQDVLVEVFKKMVDKGLSEWKLIIAGGSDVGEEEFVRSLRLDARGYPIEIIENPDFENLKKLYGKAKIFWSASGFGIDEEKDPEKVEHFGITVVEAIAAGCVPAVTNKGGHKEIIKNGENGFLWGTEEELLQKTQMLFENKDVWLTIASNGKNTAKKFSHERFEEEIVKLVA